MNEDFRDWLKGELRRRNMSQRELSRRAELAQGGLSRVLSGHRTPGLGFYKKIADALNEPLDNILRLAKLTDEPTEYKTEVLEIAEIAQRLPPDELKQLLAFARFLKPTDD